MHQETASSADRAGSSPVSRGKLTVFLGMAAGVGKTYRMLQEGHAELENGRDVVIGLLETHGREETRRLADGLPLLPRRRVLYRDTELEDLDLPAVLARAPEVCLIDELAHTNAPGLEHPKRYEDVEDVLNAGIDVLSTVNVQHLESLNDTVAELSGVRVRETIPDAILGRADEVILIDLPPDALLERLRAGKVYPPDRVESALNNFFKIENLTALREIALRQVAEEVESKRLVTELVGVREESIADAASQAVGERLLALVEPYPGAQRLVRRAWRSAQRLAATARPPVGQAARPQALRRRATLAPGAAPARLCARRPLAGRGIRPGGRGGGGGRRRAGHDLHPHGPRPAGARRRPTAHAAPAAPDGAAARRRRPHGGRPLKTKGGNTDMSAVVVVLIAIVASASGSPPATSSRRTAFAHRATAHAR